MHAHSVSRRRFFKKKSLKIELIDAKEEIHKQDLIQNGGRQKVPCLRIQLENKPIRWIYESNDIIEFISTEIEWIALNNADVEKDKQESVIEFFGNGL